MKDRILFRGFFPDKSGKDFADFNGDPIRGRWIYWNEYGQLCRLNGDLICNDLHHIVQVQRNDVIEASVGQLVLIDTRHRFFFDGDVLKETITDSEFEIVRRNSGVSLRCLKHTDANCIGKLYAFQDIGNFEIIGNMWEVGEA